jgi:hypothetical protein
MKSTNGRLVSSSGSKPNTVFHAGLTSTRRPSNEAVQIKSSDISRWRANTDSERKRLPRARNADDQPPTVTHAATPANATSHEFAATAATIAYPSTGIEPRLDADRVFE